MGRGIVSYTGEIGTEYTRDSNVDFWEMKNCGKCDTLIKDKSLIEHVEVGDFLLIKEFVK